MYRGIKNEKNIVIRPILSTLCYIFAAEKGKIKLFLAKRDIYPEKIVYLSQIKKYTNI
jgi:hypothetical protein